MSTQDAQLSKVQTQDGFLAALDQSGGSTPKALKLYGVGEDAYSNDDEMFGVIHQMRTRIILSPAFNGNRVLGAILFENTMDREIEGKASAKFLWEELRDMFCVAEVRGVPRTGSARRRTPSQSWRTRGSGTRTAPSPRGGPWCRRCCSGST